MEEKEPVFRASAQIFKVLKSCLYAPRGAVLCKLCTELPASLVIISQFRPQSQHTLTIEGTATPGTSNYLQINNTIQCYLLFDAFQSMFKGLMDNNEPVEVSRIENGLFFVQKCDVIEKSFFVMTYNNERGLSTPLQIETLPPPPHAFVGSTELKARLNFENITTGEAPVKMTQYHGKARSVVHVMCTLSEPSFKMELDSQTIILLKFLAVETTPRAKFTLEIPKDELCSFFYLSQRANATQTVSITIHFVQNILLIKEVVKKKELIITHTGLQHHAIV